MDYISVYSKLQYQNTSQHFVFKYNFNFLQTKYINKQIIPPINLLIQYQVSILLIRKLNQYLYYQLKIRMQVRFRLVAVNQIKCNFCHNWIEGFTLSRNTLNACENCIFKYREKQNEVRTESGEVYKMLLLSEEEHQGMTIPRLMEHFQQIRQSQLEEQIDQVQVVRSIIEGVEDCTQFKTKLGPNLRHALNQSNDPTDDVNRSFMRTKSKSVFDPLMNKQKPIYQSYDYDQNNNQFLNEITSKPRRGFKRFQDLCPNLAKTRFSRRYQFYYGSDQIKKYQQKDRKLERTVTTDRTFGTSISNVFPANQYLQLKQKQQKVTHRSTTSIESLTKSLKLSEEELKNRIDAYLDSRYTSLTLHRLMATYVKQAYHKTKLQGKMLELVSFDISTMDLLCYLSLFDFDQINTIKLIKVSLSDDLLHTLVDAIKTKTVERLVVSCNKLTENSLPVFLNRSLPYLKEIYLGKNRINKYRMKQNIIELRRKFVLYL